MTGTNKVVVISVSSNLTEAVKQVMLQNKMDFPIYEGTLDQAVEIAKKCQEQGTKVFVSRGRTATYLQEHVNATVVNISTSFFSYAMAVKQLQNGHPNRKIAILGFSDQFRYISQKFQEIWGSSVRFINLPWRNKTDERLEKEFCEKLVELKKEGIEAVVGNNIITRAALKIGIESTIHLPDLDMVASALHYANYVAAYLSAHEEKEQAVLNILNVISESALRINHLGEITDSNLAAKHLFTLSLRNLSILKLFPSFNWREYAENPKEIREKILRYNQQNLLVDLIPMFTGSIFSGAILTAQKASRIQSMEQSLRADSVQRGLLAKLTFSDCLGISESILKAVSRAKRIARTDNTVLLTGETGTGKELFAQSIHNFSFREDGPFVAINCAALAPSVLESELFGYAKGAFTGALSGGKEGIFEMAHNGTIFLDEIGELPLEIQAKLLRVIQEKKIVRIGDNKVIPVNVRIIAATNRNLEQEIKLGRFRADLYYRICVLSLSLPSLRDRKEDIPILAEHFLSQLHSTKTFSEGAMKTLQAQTWLGNIRQLSNLVEQANLFIDSQVIHNSDISQFLPTQAKTDLEEYNPKSIDGKNLVLLSKAESRKTKILETLQECNGNRGLTAKKLGISTVTLWRDMKKLQLAD